MVTVALQRPDGTTREFEPTVGAMARVIGSLLRPHLGLYTTILALSVVEGVLGGLAIATLFPIFGVLTGATATGGGRILAWIHRFSRLLPLEPPIVAAGCLLLLLACLKFVVTLSRETLTGYASAEVGYRLKRELLGRYIGEGYPFFLNHRQGELAYNLYAGCARVANLFSQLPLLVSQLVNILALLGLLFLIHATATAALVGFAAALHGCASWVSRRVSYPIGRAKKECMISEQVVINEFITGFKQIFVFGTVGAWAALHDRVNRRFKRLFTRETALLATPKNVWELMAFAGGAAAVMWVGVRNPSGVSGELVTVGVYLVALQRLLPFMSTLNRQWMAAWGYLPDAFVAYEAVRSAPPAPRTGGRVAGPLARAIRLEAVTFAYPDRGVVLRDVDMVFERGKVTAIVGGSGAGKTTVLNLILGLFQPTAGAIRIDHVDLREVRLESWLSQIGFVSQDTFIFHGTVRDNIAFFRESSQQEIEEAARLANAHDFISEFPDGYDTVVGARGMKLSGGQQQRLALARALLKKPAVFVLDEATSSLDSLSEALIQDSVRKIAVNRTVIVVAHRLSTVIDADRILVLKDGRVVEEGTHGELLGARGHYFRLYGGGEGA